MTEWWAFAFVLLSATIGGTGALFFKLASARLTFNPRSAITNYQLWLGGICYVVGTSCLIIALKGGPLSTLYPFVALSYPWVMILSIVVLNEQVTKIRWMGTALIVLGVILIGIGS